MSMTKIISHIAAASLLAVGAVGTGYAADQPASPSAGTEAGTYLSDSAITAKVKAALLSNKLSGISVTTELGVVALVGTVANEEIRQTATKVASAVDGVRGVDYTGLNIKAS